MNRKAKGSRNERKARDLLKLMGFSLVVKSGASLGLFDLVGLGIDYDHVLLVQVKTNRRPSKSEMDLLRSYQCPAFCRKEVWVYFDHLSSPEIMRL